MSSRNQNATKRQTKTFPSKSTDKSKDKNGVKKEEQRKTTSQKMVENTSKQNYKLKSVNKAISDKSSTKSTNSTTTTFETSTSTIIKKKPSTLLSSRVSTSQFFPSKQMYANAIKTVQESSKDRERNKTRTLSPSEVKVLKNDSEHLETYVSRPKTATITKPQTLKCDSDEYEDDFDSYESDFEEYTSSKSSATEISTSDEEKINITEAEEERKLDSGNFELPEVKYKQVLDNIKESDNEIIHIEQNRSNFTSLSDEGFEDGKLDKGGQFINFVEAQRKQNHLKSITIKRKRGEELANMIKLDNQAFTILEMESVSYSTFIKKFGNNNTIQISTQTGHDNISEEIQTEQVDNVNKWSQYPVKLSEIKKNNVNLDIYKQEYLGVGTDNIELSSDDIKYNEHSLIQFINYVSDVVLNLLEERSQQKNCKDIEVNSNQIPFSEGYISFNTKLSHLENLPVVYATFSSKTTKLITTHDNKDYSYVCIWKISDPNMPEYSIMVHGTVTCCVLTTYIYGGLNDGTIAIWDLKEHQLFENDKITSPTFITNINTGHVSKLVSLEIIENEEKFMADDTCNSQVYSLDEDGYLIIWTIIVLKTISKRHVSLQQTLKVSLKQLYPHLTNLQCTSMSVNKLDTNHIFISTNYGQILHFVSTTGTKENPKIYNTDWVSQCNCITTCPFSPLYMLAAYENGNLALFSRNAETPLIALTNCDGETDDDRSGIVFAEWSKNKPCVLYAKDRKNCIHIWDLSVSDIFPIYTVPFKEEIDFIKLSPDVSKDEHVKRSYLVIISDKYNVNLHILNKDHGRQDPIDYQNNVKKFLNYVNRL